MKNKALVLSVATGLVAGTMFETDPRIEKKLYKRPKGREHRINTEEEKATHKAHQKKIKARRNARKGIYENKIVYPTNRKAKKVRN